jgi:hypothetical protein
MIDALCDRGHTPYRLIGHRAVSFVATRNVRMGMVAASSEFQTKILRRSAVADEYKLYRAALEWDLTDPIVIETRKDLILEKRWQNHLQPYHHQVTNLITFCRRLPVTLLADDVGLGKTISAGLIAGELSPARAYPRS